MLDGRRPGWRTGVPEGDMAVATVEISIIQSRRARRSPIVLAMKNFALLALIFVVVACGQDLSSPDGVADAMLTQMEKMADVMEKVDSKESADAAADELVDIAKELKTIGEAMKKLELSKDEEKALEKKYESRRKEIMERLQSAGMKGGRFLMTNQKVQKAMQEAMGTFR